MLSSHESCSSRGSPRGRYITPVYYVYIEGARLRFTNRRAAAHPKISTPAVPVRRACVVATRDIYSDGRDPPLKMNGVGGWLVILIFMLTIWNPASLALRASSIVWTVEPRSTLSLVLLAIRFAITSVGVAAGIALWRRRPGAVWLAKVALMIFGIEAVARLSTRVDLSSAPRGTRLPLALFVVVHNAGWYLYLQLSRRVRATYGLESQP